MGLKIKCFDEEHETMLEEKVNEFLETIDAEKLVDIKYQLATMFDMKSQIYCFSAMVIYKS